MNKSLLFLLLSLLLVMSCKKPNQHNDLKTNDPHSYSKPEEAVVKHLFLDITADFERKIIHGCANLDIERKGNTKEIILDTKMLTIDSVYVTENKGKKYKATFRLGEGDSILGKPLHISIDENTQTVHVYYKTSPEAEALQWLTPQQTQGKKYPCLLTQSQAINARTWIPIQDGPGIRFSYSAMVRVPKELLALMSAENPVQKNKDGVYHFSMKQIVPAYLMALSVGDFAFAEISNRCGVYAEPSMLEKCKNELTETEEMIQLAEKMYGKYAWERYDILILPPSFPFGGMENPRLTFATPTIIVGDRSLVSLVAHELAHSWSGNLVTNANWNDFWLNEGFTVYFEYRIMEALKGRDYSEMLAILSQQELAITLEDLGEKSPDTHLKLDLKGRNPDDGVTDIAYIKGYFFLRLLEETVGREKWDGFLKAYFNENAFKTMTTEKFLDKLDALLTPEQKSAVNIQAWVYGPGIPANCPSPKSTLFASVDAYRQKYYEKGNWNQTETQNWNTHQWVHFLRGFPSPSPKEKIAGVDNVFHFTESQNPEIQGIWFEKALQAKYEKAYPAVETFLVNVGRRKFLMPLYKEMAKTPQGKEMALKIYQKARPNYHPISYMSVDEVLK
ncbi:MAG: M1 family metallopeptidase [Bacteroidia bacterium]|nr:M1 family metallopeptidase [Bacteroidia bacterium]